MNQLANEWVPRSPAVALRPFVDGYVGYRMLGSPPGLHRGLPSRHMTFIISIGDVIDVIAQTDPAQRPDKYRCVLSGLQASPAIISHDGNQEGVAIELTPLGSRALLGMPAAELWDQSLELADVVGPIGTELWERMQSAAGWDERFALCDRVLLRLTGGGEVAPELHHSWATLVASRGRISVNDLASDVGYSRPHLTRLFRSEFGLSPKLAAKVVRFERAQKMMRSAPEVTIAGVAASCGYYDQAHLYRDFTELAGCTPSELLRDEAPYPSETSIEDTALSTA